MLIWAKSDLAKNEIGMQSAHPTSSTYPFI